MMFAQRRDGATLWFVRRRGDAETGFGRASGPFPHTPARNLAPAVAADAAKQPASSAPPRERTA